MVVEEGRVCLRNVKFQIQCRVVVTAITTGTITNIEFLQSDLLMEFVIHWGN